MNKYIDYSKFFSSSELLANAVIKQYERENGKLEFPINPFKILKSLDVKLLVKKFTGLEGIFISAVNDDDIDIVAINVDRNIYRQRFTAAHEICHCIKDRDNDIICPIDGRVKNSIEKFADEFAACLLMPLKELSRQVNKYLNDDGYIEIQDVIYISEYFGVSFESCVYRIAYKLQRLDGETERLKLKSRIRKAKADKLREEFGFKNKLKLKRDFIEYCCFASPKDEVASKIKFKQFLVLNENRLEGIDVTEEQINYILADLRLNGDYSKYGNEKNPNILEALGNIELIDYVLYTEDKIDIWKLQKMQRLLYGFTPFGNQLPFPRQENNRIDGAEISTVDYTEVIPELIKVDEIIKELVEEKDDISIGDYILKSLQIHHRLTVIHPLSNGNGRCSRAILIWLFRIKKLPPIYIRLEEKPIYLNALNKIDTLNEYDELEELIIDKIFESISMFD